MSAFGWPAFYEADGHGRDWLEEQAEKRSEIERSELERKRAARHAQLLQERELAALRSVEQLLSELKAPKGLSYTLICALEWDTEIRTGPWAQRLTELREAQARDKERHESPAQGDTPHASG